MLHAIKASVTSKAMDMPDPSSWGTAMELLKKALEILKLGKDLLPQGANKERVESAVAEAERTLRLAEAQAASDFGYDLCRCTFPPQIMLKQGDENSRCPHCGNEKDEQWAC